MTSSENTSPSLQLVRRLNAAPEQMFDALVNPETMCEWLFTEPETTFEIDLVVSGKWSITTRRDGTDCTATGEYIEIMPPRRLAYTFAMPQFSPNSDIITVEIGPEGLGFVVTITQAGEDIADELRQLAAGAKGQSEQGWERGFDALSALLEERA